MTPKGELRILHLEDDPADALLIERALETEGIVAQIHRVATRDAFISALSDGKYDLILSDYSLPGFDGLSALALVRERDAEQPFVLVTGTIGEDRAAESLKIGANDFVLKDRLKRLGTAVRRALEEVEERAHRRLLEEQLRQAQKLEAVGRLTGSVAHDFNNLVSVILSTAELLLTDLSADDPRRADITAIQEAAERGAALVRQLLAFSRRQKLQPQVLDLNAVLKGLEPLLKRLVKQGVKLDVRLDPNLATVKADPGQLEQVVVNLCVNARDAMPNGGTITVETSTADIRRVSGPAARPVEPGRYIRLSVTDTGTGMDQETMTRIFEPFFTTKPEGMGTGLGLATVYGIIQQSGGHIWVSSQTGMGTTFEIFLPPHDGAGAKAP